MQATLILENGQTFVGTSIGSTEDRVCEMVFNTSMVGYQEILTDYPLIGNYGVNEEDDESFRPWAEALIVRHLAARGSNFRCQGSLDDYLKAHNITGIENVDTRAITRILRKQGTMNGMITCAEDYNLDEVLQKIKAYRVEGTVEKVSIQEKEEYPGQPNGTGYKIALYDFGEKRNMTRCLNKRGCDVTVFPCHTPAEEILQGGFDGVMLSNGPGDPADCVDIIQEIKKLYQSDLPIFAVCLGHQLMAPCLTAIGAPTIRCGTSTASGSLSPPRTTAITSGKKLSILPSHGWSTRTSTMAPARVWAMWGRTSSPSSSIRRHPPAQWIPTTSLTSLWI